MQEQPQLAEGKRAVCPFCGFLGGFLNRCQRCSRTLPCDVRIIEVQTNSPVARGQNSKETVIAEDYGEQERLQGAAIKGGAAGGGVPCNLDVKSLAEGNYPMLKCRSVRIGSYKTAPSEHVLFTPKGIQLVVPGMCKPETVSIVIWREEMLCVLIHLGRSLPVVFVHVTPACAQRVARQLQMNPRQEPYFSPNSSNETHKRITFLPESVREEEKITLLDVLAGEAEGLLRELSQKEANEILVRSSPREAQKTMQRSSSRPHGSSGFTVTAVSSSPLPSPSPAASSVILLPFDSLPPPAPV